MVDEKIKAVLRDIHFKPYYSKANNDDIGDSFYLPCLSHAVKYDRATGYFGSTIFIIAWGSLKQFVNNGGKMRIMCSPYLAEKDVHAIEEGLQEKNKQTPLSALFEELRYIFGKPSLTSPERVLACLIANNILDVKIVIGKNDVNRLFHDKVGIFYDDTGESVAFRGSINETYKGLSNDGNFESLDVFLSWGENNDKERLQGIKEDFEEIWENKKDVVMSFGLPDDIMALIQKHANDTPHWQNLIDEIQVSPDKKLFWSADKSNDGRKPRAHQLKALEQWEANGRRGIFEHATGSGKTFTAMCAIRKELEFWHPVLILVPSIGLLTQWESELKETLADLDINYLLCGGGNDAWKEGRTLYVFTKSGNRKDLRVVIAVMDTASNDEFISKIVDPSELMIVADEVHRTGAKESRKFFSVSANARLGLSATPKRYNDKEGTAAIIGYFGNIIQPPYTLKNAIEDNVLCRYFYEPQVVHLSYDEQKQWDELSQQINKIYAIESNKSTADGLAFNNERIKKLLIARARICKNAKEKVQLARRILKERFQKGQRWIVYCDNKKQLDDVCLQLQDINIPLVTYYSSLPTETKKLNLQYFENNGGVVVSIRCLDEGIDIPCATHALILASSQNPREFIQRRGRILRKSENKNFAYLYDAIVVPENFASNDAHAKIVEMELVRAIQFGEWSEDKKCISDLKVIALQNNIDFETLHDNGYEED